MKTNEGAARKKKLFEKIPQRKIFTLLIAIPVLEVALFGYLYLGETNRQKQLQTEFDVSYATMKSLPETDYARETELRNSQLEAANVDAFMTGKRLATSMEPAQIYQDLYSLAAGTGVSITEIASSGELLQKISRYSFSMLPLSLSISGTKNNINNFTTALAARFNTAAIKSVYMTAQVNDNSTDVFADMNINIYSYRGNENE